MIKFTLTIWVCSFLSAPSVCLSPAQSPILYDSWYECSRAAHQESLKLLSKMGYSYVNKGKIAMKYNCTPAQSI